MGRPEGQSLIVPELAAATRLLPAPVSDARQLGGARRPWAIDYASTKAVLRWNDAARWRAFGFTDEDAVASTEWLHALLRELAAVGFTAPYPIDDLDGRSFVAVDGGIWELLSHVPGEPMGWSHREMFEAGALLARFHDAAQRLTRRAQRPGAQPFADCAPGHSEARGLRAAFDREFAQLRPEWTKRGVIHGDATQSNVVVDDHGSYHLVDFALAYVDHVLADTGSALWRNGRASPDSIVYDPARAAGFVRGYASVRPLGPGAGRAIVTF
ncbi:MAG TPA: phosphotransferase, partial [Candidatus Limnocylindria bacterium]|nr:phosphotransferase [Candidatus Limnocylindria bacterium]